MEKNKLIIVALIVVIIAILAGIFATMPNTNKQDTNLTFMSNSTINEGDSIVIKLTDANGTALVNQTVNVTVADSNKTSAYFSVVTNETGFGALNINKSAGEYNVTITYAGNDNYDGCGATQKLIIKEDDVDDAFSQNTTTSSTQKSTTSSTQKSTTKSTSNSNDDDNYYDGRPRSDYSPGEQAAIDDARANGYATPGDYYEATGKNAGQAYMDAHPEESGPRT